MMDMTESIQPRSDQINADDLIAGPMTVTVREVKAGAAEQPFDFLLVETDRAYRPSKTMRRVIVNAWGPEAANYAGRRLTLYREPSITFGGQKVGGIRISHMSHIDGTVEVMAQTTRGKREKFTVQPIPESANPGDNAHAASRQGVSTDVAPDPAQTGAHLDDDPVTLPTVGKQITALSQQERADLYGFCGVESKLSAAEAHALFTAKADEFGVAFSDPPDIRRILERARTVRTEAVTPARVDEFDHFATTGQDLDVDPQTVIA